jgi:hypothetical protein
MGRMGTLYRMTVDSIAALVKAVRGIRARWTVWDEKRTVTPWFRGVEDRGYRLLPGFYRPDNGHLDETTILADFDSLAPLYLEREPRDEWDWYFTAQHYGLPTRLLDWTENLLIALYFAITSPIRDRKAIPCIWMIDASMLNRLTIGVDDDCIIAPVGEFSAHWLPGRLSEIGEFSYKGRTYKNRLPMAIMPRRATRRILAQQGMFTVHGTENINLTDVFATASRKQRLIACIEINPASIELLRADLRLLGMNRLSVFPELQQIGMHVKDTYAHFASNPKRRPVPASVSPLPALPKRRRIVRKAAKAPRPIVKMARKPG